MMTFLGPTIVAALLAQAPAGRGVTGEVVDDQGKPVANAQVVFYAPPDSLWSGRFGRGADKCHLRRQV
jgi:hypothetical protein